MARCRGAEPRLAGVGSLALAAAAWLAVATPVSATQLPAEGAGDRDPTVVYLVRHAEKADDGSEDPPLTLAGEIRVRVLRQLLGDAGLTHIHTTDWRRTRDTARPFAEELGGEAQIYDSRQLESLASYLQDTPGTHLVVGHSNTTPVLVEALGGDPHDPIHEMEYDRLYIVVINPGQAPVTTLLRFGEPYVPGSDFGLRADRGTVGSPSPRRRN